MQGSFKAEHSFEKRVELCSRLRKEYTDRIPIILESNKNSGIIITRKKFLAPHNVTMTSFLMEIRKQIKVDQTEAIFLFCGSSGMLAPTTSLMSQVYEKYRDADGFLYIVVALENSFG
jgi:GABA(A) receptor-associated protein